MTKGNPHGMQSPIKRLTDFIVAAERGDFPAALPQNSEHSEAEWRELEDAVLRLVMELKSSRNQKVDREHIEKELRISRAIQSTLLPSSVPEIPGLDIGAIYRPAEEIGGDYYDFIDVDSDHLGIAIADVSGKSISGAMFMTILRNTLRSQSMLTLSPSEAIERTGRLLLPSLMSGFFVSLMYAILDKPTNTLVCANAGHLPLLWYRAAEKRCDWVRPKGIALGLLKNEVAALRLEELRGRLEDGDRVLFYTDGVTEAADPSGQQFGRGRLADFVIETSRMGGREFISTLGERIVEFTQGVSPLDDITAVVLQRNILHA